MALEIVFIGDINSANWWNVFASFNSLRPRLNWRSFADIFKCIFLNENVWISIKISLKFVPKGTINNNPALVQIMAWRRPGHKPISETMMVSLLAQICVAWPQWVNLAVSLVQVTGSCFINASRAYQSFLRKYTTTEITFMIGILNWNFVRVPKTWLLEHTHIFSLQFS